MQERHEGQDQFQPIMCMHGGYNGGPFNAPLFDIKTKCHTVSNKATLHLATRPHASL